MVFGAAGLYTHYYSGFSLLTAAGYTLALFLYKKEFNGLKRWFVANIGIALLFVPWLPAFWVQLNSDPISHLKPISSFQVFAILVQFFSAFGLVPFSLRVLIAGCIYTVLFIGFVAMIRSLRQTPEAGSNYLLFLSVVAGTFGLAIIVSYMKPVIFIRYFLGIVPFVCLLLAYGFFRIRPKFIGATLLAFLVVFSILFGFQVTTYSWRPDFRAVASHIEKHGNSGHALLFFPPKVVPFLHLDSSITTKATFPYPMFTRQTLVIRHWIPQSNTLDRKLTVFGLCRLVKLTILMNNCTTFN